MSFDLSRLRRADRIVGGGAVAFFIFLFFFKWFGVSSNAGSIAGINVNVSRTGWNTFTNSRWIWLITIIVALVAVAVAAGALQLKSPVPFSVLVTGLGALSTVLILYRIIHHPTASASFGTFHASVGIKIGIWLGLIAAAAITYGGYLAMREEGTSLTDVRDQASAAMSSMGGASSQPPPAAPPATGSAGSPPPPAPAPPASSAPPLPPPSPGAEG